MAPLTLKSAEDFAGLLAKYETFLFDLDGVIWTGPGGTDLTPRVGEALDLLRSLGKRLAFITNNSTNSREDYLAKFHRLGLTHVQLHEIFTCGSASASYLVETVLPSLPENQRGIYLIGQAALEHELTEKGLKCSGGTDPDDDVLLELQDFSSITPDPSIGVVLYGFAMRVNYKQLAKGFNYLASNPGCKLVLTNDDHSLSLPGGVAPGEGAIASVLTGATKTLKPIIVGKPYQPILDEIKKSFHFDPATTIMFGDRLDTDVLFGKRGGVSTMMVLSGFNQLKDLVGLHDHEEPDFIADNVGALLLGAHTPPQTPAPPNHPHFKERS